MALDEPQTLMSVRTQRCCSPKTMDTKERWEWAEESKAVKGDHKVRRKTRKFALLHPVEQMPGEVRKFLWDTT